jgi:superfamily I DNA/RNA helicase
MTLVRPEDWRPQGVPDLEPRAWEALREVERSVLVTAGAGAGKTEFLAQKATYLLQTGLCPAPKRILAISFKRDAARNLSARVEKRCPPEQARRFNSFTFDAFGKSLLDRFRAAIPESFSPPAGYRIVFPRRQDYADFLDQHGFYGINAAQLERAIARTRLPLGEPATEKHRAVAEYWRVQYDDPNGVALSFLMINRLVDLLLCENPSIRRALQLTYPVVFLDEFQDTTFAQFELLHTAFDGSGAVFTAVGDDKQRIMVWAGAMPDAFDQFEQDFQARRISLLSNWRSHEDLVRIQHVIASRIDPDVEYPEARADRDVDGDVAAIWEFESEEEESEGLTAWIEQEVESGNVESHDVAILVRMHANEVEADLAPAFADRGLRLRHEARNVGDIAIQDLLGEELTAMCLPLLRLGATNRSADDWNAALRNMQFLQAVDPADDLQHQQLQDQLAKFVRELRRSMRGLDPDAESAAIVAQAVIDFIGVPVLRQAFSGF